MARHIRKQFPGAKCHVTNRGNGRQEIFAESGVSDRFVEQVTEAAERDGVILYAYCLMPNHFHLSVMSKGPYANGDEDFQQETTEWAIAQGRRRKRPVDAIVPERKPVSMSTIERAVVREFNLKAGVLKCKSARLGLARWFLVEWACTLGGLTQRAVADYLGGVTEHAIGKARQRLHLRLATDEKVRRKWENLRDGMSIV